MRIQNLVCLTAFLVFGSANASPILSKRIAREVAILHATLSAPIGAPTQVKILVRNWDELRLSYPVELAPDSPEAAVVLKNLQVQSIEAGPGFKIHRSLTRPGTHYLEPFLVVNGIGRCEVKKLEYEIPSIFAHSAWMTLHHHHLGSLEFRCLDHSGRQAEVDWTYDAGTRRVKSIRLRLTAREQERLFGRVLAD